MTNSLLRRIARKFSKDMVSRGFEVDDQSSAVGGSLQRYFVDVRGHLNQFPKPSARVEFVKGDYGKGNGVYVFVPGRISLGVASLRAMASGVRILTEIDYWANENGELVERKIQTQVDEPHSTPRNTSELFTNYKIRADKL